MTEKTLHFRIFHALCFHTEWENCPFRPDLVRSLESQITESLNATFNNDVAVMNVKSNQYYIAQNDESQ